MIRLIAAIDQKRGIAKGGVQPWYIPDDETYFAEMTKSHGGIVLVGSTTFKTFKRPLPDRTNFVATRHDEPLAGAELVHDIEAFLQDQPDVWVIGGAYIYQTVLDAGLADELYLTHIEADFGCDQFFPIYDGYQETARSKNHSQNGFTFSYAVYKK